MQGEEDTRCKMQVAKNSLPVYRSTSQENTRYKMQADSYNAGGKCEEENTENKTP